MQFFIEILGLVYWDTYLIGVVSSFVGPHWQCMVSPEVRGLLTQQRQRPFLQQPYQRLQLKQSHLDKL